MQDQSTRSSPTPLVLQAVHSNAISPTGPATILLNNLGLPDQGTIEAPSLTKFGSTYILFFSSGCFTTDHYTVAYATAPSITGPYTRLAQPLFRTGDYGLVGPGGMSVWQEGGYMVFHAWVEGGIRTLFGAVIQVVEGVVRQRNNADIEIPAFELAAVTLGQLMKAIKLKGW